MSSKLFKSYQKPAWPVQAHELDIGNKSAKSQRSALVGKTRKVPVPEAEEIPVVEREYIRKADEGQHYERVDFSQSFSKANDDVQDTCHRAEHN